MIRQVNLPRLVIGAPHGQSGKTTITLGLLGALRAKGFKVQPFKKGPDYIDAGWMTTTAQRTCHNLDCYLMDEVTLKQSFFENGLDADLSIIEGAMGFYDGLDQKGSGSTAQIAKILDAPVLLVVDCKRATRSIAATVMGFQRFDPEVKIAGVVLNNIATLRQRGMIESCINEYCGIPVLGVVPKNARISLPNRHLGLVPSAENKELQGKLSFLQELMLDSLDFEGILKIAGEAPPLELIYEPYKIIERHDIKPTIGVIRDQVFSFYYPENLEALEKAGAELVFIDSLEQQELPSIDALFIGGGFPEIFAEKLAKNKGMRETIKKQIEAGLPTYAECGGMLYLGKSLILKDKQYPMVGALPFDSVLEAKPLGHGYTLMESLGATPFLPTGAVIKGHEFHNTRLLNLDEIKIKWAYKVQKGYGINGKYDGLVYKNVLASYNHLHALGIKEWALNFVELAGNYQLEKISG